VNVVPLARVTVTVRCDTANGPGSELSARATEAAVKIVQPSAAINPDRIAYVVALTDGSSANGIVLEDTAQTLVLGQVAGVNLTIPKDKIAGMKASAVSLMPEGLLQALTPNQIRDLMTFLLTEPATVRSK